MARTCNDIVRETRAAREWAGFPAGAVAIGGNGGGDQLILLAKDETPGELGAEVYWRDHETGEVTKVADDFAELA